MNIEGLLRSRSDSKCELCGSQEDLCIHEVSPSDGSADSSILICSACDGLINEPNKNAHHWHCLKESMWSEVAVVQVLAWRILNNLNEAWSNELLEMLYLDESTLSWAKSINNDDEIDDNEKHLDSNGVVLNAGDTVVITKDLNVKGSSIVAKRGTAVRSISLVPDKPEQIEGRVSGQQIVILTKYVKKS
ncbi:MAG: PhnA protein [Francisellaceae bacterium]|jgi:protein PhnA|nr:PhnA protein [Francisellaceae bacterium]MBT6208220.1 PhnA protein [Francisellaceae bacterium]MBT6538586.1 PhnA protein [Francisellaceae bacterium]